ncbi:MAG: hypothetical protein OES24_08000 [Acidimicrobiia bacterium]|nr:hypothetical protein [Acidimicrobiia bacterium]
MSVTDRERRHVFTQLERVIGLEAAESIMQLLPFQSSTDLATRSDLNATTVLLQGQMAALIAVASAANAIAVITALVT